MKITLFFINWNDAFYLPYIKSHYGAFCQRIVMWDNHSTDESIFLAKFLGFEVRSFGAPGVLDDQMYLDIKNHCWKEERENGQQADYVIVCDADEFVVIDSLRGTAPKVTGYNMISDKLPGEDIFEINTGDHSLSYSKQAIFSPKHIEEINFRHGCHVNDIKGLVTTDGLARLFHYRCIGGFDRLYNRHLTYQPRMSPFNLKHNMGCHYLIDKENKMLEWEDMKLKSKQLW